MDFKKLRLEDIYKSISNSINLIQEQIKAVRALVGDVADIENFANHVLKPLCNSSLQYRVATLDSLKVLQALSQTTPNSTNPGQIRKNTDDSRERICGKIAISNPPPVNNGEVCLRGRSFLPSCVRYPAIKPSLTQNPKGHHYMPRFLKPIRPVGQAPQRPWVHEVRETIYDHHQQKMELNVYIDRYEQATSQLQKTFTLFSQRVLVPLRTFCKISNRRFSKKFQDGDLLSGFEKKDSGVPWVQDPDQCELFIVQTMNQIKQLLWTHSDSCFDQIFSYDGFSEEVAKVVDCERFPMLRLLPDALQKFDVVVDSGVRWLKRDKAYTESARNGLRRAHRRYVKTEKLWKEARYTERQLCSEFNHVNFEIDANILRLDALQSDIEVLREDLHKRNDQWRTAEARDTDEATECTRVLLKAHKKKIACLKNKIATKERNYCIMENRIQDRKTDQKVIEQKIQTSKEFSDSLQKSMIKLFHHREAWKKRYFEKNDSKMLKKKLDSVGLRIPLPTVREKTFILKTRMENLVQAAEIVSDRLTSNHISWSTLCYHLTWPNHFLVSLQNIKKNTKQNLSLDDGTFSDSPKSDKNPGIPLVDGVSSPAEQVIDYVERNLKGTEKDRCSLMLKLWLQCSGDQASLGQLIKALQLSRMEETASRLQELNSS